MSMMVSFVLSFFPRDVLDEILNLIESVSEDFPSYSPGLPLMIHVALLLWRKFAIHSYRVPLTPLSYNLTRRPSLQTESNAFSMSMKVAKVALFSLNPVNTVCVNLSRD